MRKIIVCFIVLLAATLASSGAPPDRLPSLVAPAEARGLMMIGGGVPVAAPTGCTAPQIFGWSMESTTIGNTGATDCTNSTTKTVTVAGGDADISTAQYYDGAKSLYIHWTGSTGTAVISDASTTEGTIDVWVYVIDAYPAWVNFIELRLDDNNRATFGTGSGGTYFNFQVCGNTTWASVTNTVTVASVVGQWVNIVGKWKKDRAVATISIKVGATEITDTDTIVTMTGAPTSLVFQNNFGSTYTSYYDTVKVYNTWQ